jgi:hypothetical protein
MLKTDITFERVLGTFIPGALFLFATWYLHRPFLLKYFPNTAGDPTNESFEGLDTQVKIIVFLVASPCIGLILNHFSEVGITSLFRDDSKSEKSNGKIRSLVRIGWRVITFTIGDDPRESSILRYLKSPRRERVLKMVRDWAGTDEKQLVKYDEAMVAHQHIVFRLRVLSDISRKLVDEAQFHVTFASSLLVTFMFLLPVAALCFVTSSLVDEKVRVHTKLTLLILTMVIYLGIVISSYLVKLQFRKYCSYVLTLGLHFYEASSKAIENIALAKQV